MDSILLIRPDHLGDLLFTTPALRLLRQALPQAHIACLVGPWAQAVVARNPHLDEVLTCPFPWFSRRPKAHPLEPYLVLWQQAWKLRQRGFDTAVILRFDHWWGAMLAYVADIPRRVGYDVPRVRSFLTHAVPYLPGRHEVEQNLALVSAQTSEVFRDFGSLALEFPLRPEEREWAEQYLAERGLSQDDLMIGLHPGAGAPVKRWRTEAFAQVGDTLADEYGGQVLITGSAAERGLAEAIAGRMTTRPLIAAGETTLGQLAALLARCRLVIGTDSGPLHLAVAVGTPTVHLFGPVDWRTFGPWGDPARHRVVLSGLPCIPCNRLDYTPRQVADHPCLRLITVEQVLQAASQLLHDESVQQLLHRLATR
jgi:heptosyltransferase-2/heptosyltransferase-3